MVGSDENEESSAFWPLPSPGGMSTVIRNLVGNPPPGWIAEEVSTHAESPLKMLREWHLAKKELKLRIKNEEIDIALFTSHMG